MVKVLDKARKNYEKKRSSKIVSFNTDTEIDLLDFANSIEFSKWVKLKIKEEIDERSKQ